MLPVGYLDIDDRLDPGRRDAAERVFLSELAQRAQLDPSRFAICVLQRLQRVRAPEASRSGCVLPKTPGSPANAGRSPHGAQTAAQASQPMQKRGWNASTKDWSSCFWKISAAVGRFGRRLRRRCRLR